MAKKTPQQKKRDSYERDRRNTYAESGARSRFAIARAKRNRQSRERAAARLSAEVAVHDPERAERIEGKAVVKFGGRWQKIPDVALGDWVQRQLKRRVKAGGLPKAVASTKTARVRGE